MMRMNDSVFIVFFMVKRVEIEYLFWHLDGLTSEEINGSL